MNFKEMLEIAAGAEVPVLVLGESGVGKEVAARTIHEQSFRNKGPFVALNCGAIPQTLVESILEGSEKGAYTGATTSKLGVVRAAEDGTLFLDEIGELPLQSQARLLRILQEKCVLPVGAHKEIRVNFRLICATNRNLPELIQQGKFREDLFFRLNVFPIKVPPLRERMQEFSTIANALWQRIEADNFYNAWNRLLTQAEIQKLQTFNWPGNIRQLKNILERYHLLRTQRVGISHLLCEETAQYYTKPEAARPTRIKPNFETILATLRECYNNKSRAAQKLGISRGSLCYQLKKKERGD